MATQEAEQAIASTTKDEKKKPGPNNPQEASKFVEAVEQAVTSFAKAIEKNDPDAVENAYADFVGEYYELLSNVEDYYTDASIEGVFDIITDKRSARSFSSLQSMKPKNRNCVMTPELALTISPVDIKC